ncbi:hypothetical protein ARMGADRAFT_9484 [Armillaria gallica]|uniref:Uncharacterized protein n=1 Tax=Armillaria gallica TaxID=47427 RepID=A0A2H3EAU7_ARMGA|nr:hypothetical protein ARMGADRAFT_9484 [Armillaria gallica]
MSDGSDVDYVNSDCSEHDERPKKRSKTTAEMPSGTEVVETTAEMPTSTKTASVQKAKPKAAKDKTKSTTTAAKSSIDETSPTTVEPSTATKARKTRAKKTTEPPVDTALDPARVHSASGVVSDLVAQFLAKQKGLHDLKDSYVASLDQLLEKQKSCWGAQKAVVEAQKDAFIAQKEAADAQKEAADASKAAEEAKLKTLTYAKENKIPLQPVTSTPKPVDHRPIMQPMQPPQPMVQYGFPQNVPMQYQYSVAPDTNQYAYQQAPNMSISAPPPA